MAKRKKVNVELITDERSEPYQILSEMLRHHGEIRHARLALAWNIRLKPDTDGKLILGKCIKTTDLQKEFAEYDFVIALNREAWSGFSVEQKRALMDHELCHAAPAEDEEGDQKWDERERRVWRIRKHDIEEFSEVVQRHGCYKRDLERFAEALAKKAKAPLFADADTKPSGKQAVQ